jgi:hypothetical protein
MFRVRFSEKDKQLIVFKDNVKDYYELVDEVAIRMFLPQEYTYKIVNEDEPADICIVGVQHTDNSLLKENEINILLSVENLSVGRTHYKHFNKYGRNNNPLIHHYIYNDVSHLTGNFIPAVYGRISYFHNIWNDYNDIRSSVPFKYKKFCLFTSKNLLNSNKRIVLNELSKLGVIDTLDMYNIKDKTCYHSRELISVYSKYKFIICFENSNTDGYVTEKIFNVFLSGSIPIYDGAPNIKDYVNVNSILLFDNNIINKVKLLMNEDIYKNVVKKNNVKQIQWNYPLKKYGKCFIGGCVYNCEKHLENVIKNIHKIGSVFDEYCIIVAYDHSQDNSLAILNKCKKEYQNFHILINPNPKTDIRTQNISNSRNSILNKIRELRDNSWEYFMMLDMDDVCDYDVNMTTLNNVLSRNDWDSISFNRDYYYDIWALSIEPFLFSCWNWSNSNNVVEQTKQYIEKKLKELPKDNLLEVSSAFNGCAFYRCSNFLNCSYDWTTCRKFITDEEFEKNIEATKEIPFIRRFNDDCEHRHFHMEAIHKNGARIRVSPLKLFMC